MLRSAHMRHAILTVAFVALFWVPPSHAKRTLFTNAIVFGSDTNRFVVDGDRFVHVDPLGASKVDRVDRTVDLKGAFVVPGLVDGHAHLLSLGRSLETIDLRGTNTWKEVVERVRRDAPPSGWIMGRGWDQTRWPKKAFPQHHDLSRAFPHRPVVLRRVDGHVLIANAEAMKRAGLNRTAKAPKGGRVLRTPSDGTLSGVFIDAAMPLITRHIPALTSPVRRRRLLQALKRCAQLGLTGVHDMGMDDETVAIMQSLDAEGQVPIRVHAYLANFNGQTPYQGRRFSVIGVKIFADGALGSRGAALLTDYSDKPGHRGQLQMSADALRTAALAANAKGLQVAIHAIGDHGVRNAIDALIAVSRNKPPHPPRLEHAQVVHPDDFARIRGHGIVASMQPTHATSDMRWAEKRLGPDRVRGAYAWRTMLQHSVSLVFGSDFPVESPDIRKGIYASITRTNESGRPAGGWFPAQRLTPTETLIAFSLSAARAVSAPRDRADFVVFDRDLRTARPPEILNAITRLVVVGGEVVYDAEQAP